MGLLGHSGLSRGSLQPRRGREKTCRYVHLSLLLCGSLRRDSLSTTHNALPLSKGIHRREGEKVPLFLQMMCCVNGLLFERIPHDNEVGLELYSMIGKDDVHWSEGMVAVGQSPQAE